MLRKTVSFGKPAYFLHATGPTRWEKDRIRGNRLAGESPQTSVWQRLASMDSQITEMCKTAKLSFVTGAEIPKRYLGK
jgi:hypothetical protein